MKGHAAFGSSSLCSSGRVGFVWLCDLSFVALVSRTVHAAQGMESPHPVVGTRSSGDARLQPNGLSHPRARARGASCSSLSTTEDTAEGPVEGWAPRSSIASFRAGAVECQICSGGGSEDRVAEASARVERLKVALKLLGEDDPQAEP